MRIKNFIRFINEDLEPSSIEDKSIKGDVRFGQPEEEPDYGDFDYEDWQPTGDKPRKQNPDIDIAAGEEFDYDDYYPEEDDDDESDDDLDKKGPDKQPFISDTDDEPESSDRDDYFY